MTRRSRGQTPSKWLSMTIIASWRLSEFSLPMRESTRAWLVTLLEAWQALQGWRCTVSTSQFELGEIFKWLMYTGFFSLFMYASTGRSFSSQRVEECAWYLLAVKKHQYNNVLHLHSSLFQQYSQRTFPTANIFTRQQHYWPATVWNTAWVTKSACIARW